MDYAFGYPPHLPATIMSHATRRPYAPPSLTSYGGIDALTGFSGSTTEQDVIFTPNGQILLAGPASEFACQIPNPTSNQCDPRDTR